MLIIRVQYNLLRREGECISVPVRNKYSILHFPDPVEIRIGDRTVKTAPDACILSGPDEPRWFYFPEETHINFIHATKELGGYLQKYDIPCSRILYPSDPGFLGSAFQKLRMEFLSQNDHREDMLDTQLQQLLICLSREIHPHRHLPKLEKKLQNQLHRLRLSMLSQPEKRWTVADMAQSVSLSSSRFHVVYKGLFGASPIQELIDARVDRAKILLREDRGETLSQIAEKLGYKNPYDFSRQFKQVTGISPGAYRDKQA